MRPETKKRIVCWAAGIHLFIALIYSSQLYVEFFIPSWLERPMRAYGGYSGAYTHFNFFAPAVVSQVRVRFKLGHADGSVRELEVGSSSGEVNQRLATMFNYYLRPTARPALIESWGRHMLDRHPEAQWVQTRVEMLDIPTLGEVKAGKRAQWVEVGRYAAVRESAAVR